ncbi:MAG: PAS domain S-box protein, partial [Candidatus Aminicenantaceae bacterium]
TQISEMIGCSPEEIIGSPFGQYIHPSERQRVQKNYENRIEGKEAPIIYKTIAQHKDGRNIYVILKAGAITFWEKPAIFLIAEIDPDQKDK